MSFNTRYAFTNSSGRSAFNTPKAVIDALIAIVSFIVIVVFWPLHSVPTGSRGVITIGGAIKGIEAEGYILLAPWQKLSISISERNKRK